MNILYYDLRKIRLPEPMDEDEEDEEDRGENNDCNHFITIGIDQRYRKGHMLDIYVSLVTDFQHKLIVHLNEHEPMRNLLEKIKESIDQKYDHLRGLNGLKVIDLKRVTGIDLNKGAASVSRALKNPMASIPMKGRVSQALRANDHLLCDIESLDIWIKFQMVIETPQNTLVEVEFEVKFDKTVMGEVFMRILQKLIIQIWNQYWQDTREQPGSLYKKSRNTNFVLNELKIIQIDVGIALAQMDLESEQSGLHTSSNRSVLQSTSVNRVKKRQTNIILNEIPLDKSLGEVFNYQNNCVKVKCTIGTLKDLYLQQLALNASDLNQSYTMGSAADLSQSFKTGMILSTKPIQTLHEKQGNLSARRVSHNILVSSTYAKKGNFNEFDRSPEAMESKFRTMVYNRRVSYNVRLSQDEAYHILETNQTDAMGNDFTFIEEEQSIMHFNHNSIQVITEEEEGKIRDSNLKKQKTTDQVKIPVFTGTYNPAMIHRSTDRRLTSNSQRPILTTEDEDDEARAGLAAPNFGGNIQKPPQTYTLFAIILGNVVLAKKNGIIVQDMSGAQLQNEFNLIESSQNQYSQGPLQSGYFDFETEQKQDSKPRMTQNMMMRRKNSQLTEIAEEEQQDLSYSITPVMLYGAQRVAQASKQSPSYLSMGYGEKPLGDQRKASNDDLSGQNSFHDLEQAIHSKSSGGGCTSQRKTARISSPEEVKELKKLARKTVINDSAPNDEDGFYDSKKKPGFSMIVETQSSNYYDRNNSKEGSVVNTMGDDLTEPLMMNQNLRETTIERIESTRDKNPYEHRGSQMLPANFTSMAETKKVENRVTLVPPTRKNNDDISLRLGINNRKSTLFPTSQIKNVEELQKKTKTTTDQGGSQKKNILSNFFSKFKRGGAPESSAQKGALNKQTNLEEQMLESVTEFEMLHKVQLPAWLLTHEDYQLLEIPPIKNFTICERERGQGGRDTLALFGDIVTKIDENIVVEEEQIGVSRKNLIIIAAIVLVAILFTVGIILAIAYTSASV